MPREFSRSQRMAEQIRRDISEIVRGELKDPRMGLCSFTEVRVSRDMSHALIFCSVLNEQDSQETVDTLNRAGGFLRSQLARRIKARIVPTLKFVLDDSMTRGEAMDALIKRAVSADKEHQQNDDVSEQNTNSDNNDQ
ncbi:MAG: 30S ribosome-binding factor RbfA [Gammaproteobacteria bacterium]